MAVAEVAAVQGGGTGLREGGAAVVEQAVLHLDRAMSQERFARIVGVTHQAVTELARKGVLLPGQTAGQWLLAYTGRLREEASGRNAAHAAERARLERLKGDWQEMVNAQKRRELVPTALLERILATVGRRVAAILEGMPARLRREVKGLDQEVLRLVEKELLLARNEAGTLELSLDELEGLVIGNGEQDGSGGDQEGDAPGAEEPAGAPAAALV
jgi:phage terminase Nu1 subunit (DNA packaging protein)